MPLEHQRGAIGRYPALEPLAMLGGGSRLEQILAVISGDDHQPVAQAIFIQSLQNSGHLAVEGVERTVVERPDLGNFSIWRARGGSLQVRNLLKLVGVAARAGVRRVGKQGGVRHRCREGRVRHRVEGDQEEGLSFGFQSVELVLDSIGQQRRVGVDG